MTTTSQSEQAGEISSFMTNLYGLEVTATENSTLKVENVGAIATYVDDAGEVYGHIVCDIAGAAILGAALTHIPKGGVEDAIESGQLPDNLRENVSEVLNIAVNLFPEHNNLRLVLQDVVFDAAAKEAAHELTQTLSIDVAVERYGAGGMFISHPS